MKLFLIEIMSVFSFTKIIINSIVNSSIYISFFLYFQY